MVYRRFGVGIVGIALWSGAFVVPVSPSGSKDESNGQSGLAYRALLFYPSLSLWLGLTTLCLGTWTLLRRGHEEYGTYCTLPRDLKYMPYTAIHTGPAATIKKAR